MTNLWQVVLLALAPVNHELGEPLFPLFHFLPAKGLAKRKYAKIRCRHSTTNCILTRIFYITYSVPCPYFTGYTLNLMWSPSWSHWLRNELNRCVTSYKGDSFIVFRSGVLEWNTVSLHIREILLGFLRCAGTQTWLEEGKKKEKKKKDNPLLDWVL